MKSKLLLTAALLGAATSLVAGPMGSGKSSKVVVQEMPPAPLGCEAFNGGWALSGYGLFLTPDAEYDDTFGGGIAAEYFFNPYFGLSGLAQWAEHDDTVGHNYAVDAVLRYPITSICVAPYLFAGGGVHTNSATESIGRAGVGLDWRFYQNSGLFVDWTYTFPGGDIEDYQIVRLGVKIGF
jgi:hypothetical protein